MGLFGNGHGERIAELEKLVSSLAARVVKAEATASECAERAYRYMKKAESKSRRELDANQDQVGDAEHVPTPDTPRLSSRRVWGARGRRFAAATGHPNGDA